MLADKQGHATAGRAYAARVAEATRGAGANDGSAEGCQEYKVWLNLELHAAVTSMDDADLNGCGSDYADR